MLYIKQFTFSPIQENTYVVYNDAKQAAIIDPGCYTDAEKETLVNYVADNRLSVHYLLNTHCHLDHVFGNKHIAKTYNVPLHLHPNEEVVLQYAPTSGLNWGMPFDNYTGKLIFITEKDSITLGTDVLQILSTPGHSPGSISFYASQDGFVISGDALFAGSIGRTDLPGGNQPQLLKSIHTQLFTLPPSTKVYSGHGATTSIGHEAATNPFFKN